MEHTRAELVEKYVRTAWILKIRMMSCRRTLFGREFSIIHAEQACLQLRKVTECVAYLSMLAADIEFEDIPKTHKSKYEVGAIFNYLSKQEKLLFPRRASLERLSEVGESRHWKLDISTFTDKEVKRVKNIFNQTGNLLHEFSPYAHFPNNDGIRSALDHNRRAMQAEHQWLWNRFWRHGNVLKGTIFLINLGDVSEASSPQIIREVDFLSEDTNLAFDHGLFSDFSGSVNWAEFEN